MKIFVALLLVGLAGALPVTKPRKFFIYDYPSDYERIGHSHVSSFMDELVRYGVAPLPVTGYSVGFRSVYDKPVVVVLRQEGKDELAGILVDGGLSSLHPNPKLQFVHDMLFSGDEKVGIMLGAAKFLPLNYFEMPVSKFFLPDGYTLAKVAAEDFSSIPWMLLVNKNDLEGMNLDNLKVVSEFEIMEKSVRLVKDYASEFVKRDFAYRLPSVDYSSFVVPLASPISSSPVPVYYPFRRYSPAYNPLLHRIISKEAAIPAYYHSLIPLYEKAYVLDKAYASEPSILYAVNGDLASYSKAYADSSINSEYVSDLARKAASSSSNSFIGSPLEYYYRFVKPSKLYTSTSSPKSTVVVNGLKSEKYLPFASAYGLNEYSRPEDIPYSGSPISDVYNAAQRTIIPVTFQGSQGASSAAELAYRAEMHPAAEKLYIAPNSESLLHSGKMIKESLLNEKAAYHVLNNEKYSSASQGEHILSKEPAASNIYIRQQQFNKEIENPSRSILENSHHKYIVGSEGYSPINSGSSSISKKIVTASTQPSETYIYRREEQKIPSQDSLHKSGPTHITHVLNGQEIDSEYLKYLSSQGIADKAKEQVAPGIVSSTTITKKIIPGESGILSDSLKTSTDLHKEASGILGNTDGRINWQSGSSRIFESNPSGVLKTTSYLQKEGIPISDTLHKESILSHDGSLIGNIHSSTKVLETNPSNIVQTTYVRKETSSSGPIQPSGLLSNDESLIGNHHSGSSRIIETSPSGVVKTTYIRKEGNTDVLGREGGILSQGGSLIGNTHSSSKIIESGPTSVVKTTYVRKETIPDDLKSSILAQDGDLLRSVSTIKGENIPSHLHEKTVEIKKESAEKIIPEESKISHTSNDESSILKSSITN